MRKLIIGVAVTSALVATAGCSRSGGGGGAAGAGAGAPANLKDAATASATAADKFVALAKDSYKTGTPPRLSDPTAGPLLNTVFDTSPVTRASGLKADDLDPLNQINGALLKVGMVYLMSGTGFADPSQATDQNALKAAADANTAKFSPEMGRWMDGEVTVMGAVADAVKTVDPKTNKNYESGRAKIAQGTAGAMSGVLTSLPTAGLTDDWKRDRLKALTTMAPKAATLVTPDQCKALHTVAEEVKKSQSAAVQTEVQSFEAALVCPA